MKKTLKSLFAVILVITMMLSNITVFAATKINFSKEKFNYIPSDTVILNSTTYHKLVVIDKYEGLSSNDVIYVDSNYNLVTDKKLIDKLAYVSMIKSNIVVGTDTYKITQLADNIVDHSNIIESLGNDLIEGTLGNAITGNFKGLCSAFHGDLWGWGQSYLDFITSAGIDSASYMCYVANLYDLMNLCTQYMTELHNFNASNVVKNIDKKGLSYTDAQKYEKIVRNCISSLKTTEYYIKYLAENISGNKVNDCVDAFDVLDNVAKNDISDILWNAAALKIGKELADGLSYFQSYNDLFAAAKKSLKVADKLSSYYDSYKIIDTTSPTYINVNDVLKNVQELTGNIPTSPSNNSVGSMTSSSSKSTYTTDEKVVITWTKAANATRYGLTIVNNATNEKIVNGSNFTGTSYTVGKLPAGTYRFNMCGYNSNGSAGPVSALKEFTVNSSTPAAKKYYLDLNGRVDGTPLTNVKTYATVDVYINGTRVANDVADFYVEYPEGTKYEIKDIKVANGYNRIGVEGSLSGIIKGDHARVRLLLETDEDSTTNNATGFVKYVNSRVGESFKDGYCQAFVCQAVNKYFGKDADACCATNAWSKWAQSSSRDNIPLGATVYFGNAGVIDTVVCKKDAGHSAIYVGNDTIVHAWNEKIVSTSIKWVTDKGYTYRGWGWQANYKISQPHLEDQNSEKEQSSNEPSVNTDEWLGWTTTKPSGNYETKEVYVYYHHLVTFSGGNRGAYPIGKSQLASNGITCLSEEKHTHWSEASLTEKSSSLRYIVNGKLNTFKEYTNKCCSDKYNFSTNANSLYYSGKETLYKKIEEYTVTYNANGGSGAPKEQTKTAGENLKLSNDEPTRNGYEFLGWATSKTGDVKFESGDKYSDDKNITLYAVWAEIKTYTIKYNANGGTGAPASQIKIHNEKLYITDDTPEREGYSFVGWASAKTGSVSYKSGQQYTSDKDITLYAVWKANTYTISYNANGGLGAPKNQTKKYAESININTQEPTREDYIFLGWSTSAQGSVEYAPGSVCSVNENITLYALWQEEDNEVYYIIYNANGGENAPSMQTKNEDEDIMISEVVPTREGYTFDGWAIGNDDTVAYTSGDTYKENKTLYLHALWTAHTYTISYNANGGFGVLLNQIKVHDESIILSAVEPEKEDCIFLGWSTNASADYPEYYADDVFTENTDTVLYAIWGEIIQEDANEEDHGKSNEDNQQKQEKIPFEDVPEDAWYRKDVENAYRNGLINGKSEKRYAPGDNMTYAEAIKLACTIYQLHCNGEVTLTNGSDVWYSTYVDYALENRIVRTDYSSVANEYVTRKEFVNIFYGALPLKEFAQINNVKDNIIPDVKIGDAYSGEIYTFYRAGILTGNDAKGTFKPNSNISRSEVAAIVTRMLDNGSRKEINLK